MPANAVPLKVPLVFRAGQASRRDGLVLPRDWRTRRFQYGEHNSIAGPSSGPRHVAMEAKLRAAGNEAANHSGEQSAVQENDDDDDDDDDIDDDDIWQEDGLQRWCTCMVAWDAFGEEQHVDEDGFRSEHTKQHTTTFLGSERSRRRVAVGTQDGTVYIFEETPAVDDQAEAATTPTDEQPSIHPVASKSSIASPSSQSSINTGQRYHRSELDTLSSPTAAVVHTTEAVASPSSPQNTSNGEAECMLEEQWHAGEASKSVMGGVIQALGLQEGGKDHRHGKARSTSQGQSLIASAAMSPTSSRRSHASSIGSAVRLPRSTLMNTGATKLAIGDTDGGQGLHSSASEAMTGGKISSPDMNDVQFGSQSRTSDRSSSRIGSLDALVTLQCSSPVPVSAMKVAQADGCADVLVILQRNGALTMCSMDEEMSIEEVNLPKCKVASLGESAAVAAASGLSLPTPFAKLASLRSQNNSPAPGATRSRPQSNVGHPDAASNIPGMCLFTSLQIVKDAGAKSTAVAMCYDEGKKRMLAFDCHSRQLLASKSLGEAGQVAPSISQHGEDEENLCVYYINRAGSLITEKLMIHGSAREMQSYGRDGLQVSASLAPPTELRPTPLNAASSFLRREGLSRPPSKAPSIAGSAGELSGVVDLGVEGIEKDARGLLTLPKQTILTWSKKGISLARRVGDSLVSLQRIKQEGIIDAAIQGAYLTVQAETSLKVFQIEDDGILPARFDSICVQPDSTLETYTVLPESASSSLSCVRAADDRMTIYCDSRDVWKGQVDQSSAVSVSVSLPLSMERIALGFSARHMVMTSLAHLASGTVPRIDKEVRHFQGTIKLLQLAQNTHTQSKYLLGGTEEGDIYIWDAATLELQARFSLLTSPIAAFITFGQHDNVLRLHGCSACVDYDGTVLIFTLDGLKDLYVIPGRGAPLVLLAARANELLLLYGDDRARVWDMASLELRRSIGIDQAQALLDDGRGWWSQYEIDVTYQQIEKGPAGVLSSIPTSRSVHNGAVSADIRRAVEAASRMIATGAGLAARQQQTAAGLEVSQGNAFDRHTDLSVADDAILEMSAPQARRAIQTLRPLLRGLLPFGISSDSDQHCQAVLDCVGQDMRSEMESGFIAEPGITMISSTGRELSASKTLTTIRLLANCAMLNVLSKIKELAHASTSLIDTLADLSKEAKQEIRPPSLMVLSEFLLDSSNDIKGAAQTLFVATLSAVPQEQLELLCDQYGSSLPSRGAEGIESAKSLLLLGLIATQRFTELTPLLLKDIASSIVRFLADEDNQEHQTIAIVLCSRGFTIFQNYFDAMEVVRSLFALSSISREANAAAPSGAAGTATAGASTSMQSAPSAEAIEKRDLARAATLRIAEDNTPLFMTTLSHDILHARSPAHCSATMRLVALMVRRKPHILYPNLPRLAEAVVKSLDPTVTAMRTVVHRSATIIISELITTYPTIAFHKESQRLAVGTFEGAIIMYDLKTATRLYVLEAHTASLNGLAFSQDGNRLVSLCLRDGMVKVWKTGTGFRSIFAFGSAPRQVASLFGGPRATGPAGSEGSASASADKTGSSTPASGAAHSTPRHGATVPYKSFDFGHLAGAALASAATSAAANAPTSSTSPGYLHTTLGHASSAEALLHDLRLVRFEWLGERSVRIRVAEASMVFDVA